MAGQVADRPAADLRLEWSDGDVLVASINGRCDAWTTGEIWRGISAAIGRRAPRRLVVDASGIEYCDASGAALFLWIERRLEGAGTAIEVQGLAPRLRSEERRVGKEWRAA